MEVLNREDVPVAIQDDNVELRMSEVGDMTVSFIQLKAGADLSPALVGLPDDLCPCPHWGYMLKGRLKMRTKDGDKFYEAGQAFYWAPGHAPVAETDVEYVDFSPSEEFAKVISHISGQG
jgi:hypothetical protein